MTRGLSHLFLPINWLIAIVDEIIVMSLTDLIVINVIFVRLHWEISELNGAFHMFQWENQEGGHRQGWEATLVKSYCNT
jgi:hypothetical protein